MKSHGIVLDAAPNNSKVAQQQRQASGGNLQTQGAGTGQRDSTKDLVPYSMLVPLKGIDVLANGRYRVQLNTFMNGRKKFSRNSTDLYEVQFNNFTVRYFFAIFLVHWTIQFVLN